LTNAARAFRNLFLASNNLALLVPSGAGVRLRRLFRGGHPPDHPTLEAMPETTYLKFFLFEVV
jgi:hypothetical protein